jgi:zinc and cadmium transporter
MADLAQVVFFSLLGGAVSLMGGLILLSRKRWANGLSKYAMPFAAGALLAAVFLDLLHEGVEEFEAGTVLTACLVGVVLFFFAERFLRWFHHHHNQDPHEHSDPQLSLIITGDIIHNALDGVAIAAAFLISVPTGIVTTIAVAAHEIPQEIGDFGLMLAKGMRRGKVLLVNAISALATVAAAALTFMLGSEEHLPLGLLIGLSAGFLLYIATSDIIPEIHEHSSKQKFLGWQPILLLIGVVVVGLAIQLSHGYLEENGHGHEAEETPAIVEEH